MVAQRGSTKAILDYLRTHEHLTSMQAWEMWGVTRLAAIIHNLRTAGYSIDTVNVNTTTRFGETTHYARYILRGEKNGN